MVSPVQVPPPRARRSMSGPIVLIAIGTVFLLGTMGVLDWHNLGHWFAHYWPVLLIISGIIKLVEYQQAQKQGTRASGLGAGGILLMIAIIILPTSIGDSSKIRLTSTMTIFRCLERSTATTTNSRKLFLQARACM
jgi:Domain of unknown function (DUF5668)